ncbi:ABC transporter permease [Actinomadura algeriensis]|uniref:ABC-type nitrate/sulfonate/bicarbonate transport system permease component n=1 Tax=Actinomadura algeriensis TaxID=1679523 RepID=A0ABR9K3Z8_9ACTN|nr:ABC transporter permease [Actinomadura algeriensis]MBE1537547.1 ABC-type nitrate/sulfonate/bicarbonate transport system permease component [Actinomadura algeriensis]
MTTAALPARSVRTARPGAVAFRLVRGLLHRLLPLAILVACWEAATRAADSPFFPPPTEIVQRMREMWFSGPASHLFFSSGAGEDIVPSLYRMALGLLVSVVIGVALGLWLGRSERVLAYLNPLLQFARVIPPPTMVPVFIVLFEMGTQMQVASIVFGAVWPVLLNTADGARAVDSTQMATAEVFRLSPYQRIRYLIIPSALPKIFAGLRLALSLSLILMIFAELLPGTSDGLGFQLTNAQSMSDLLTIWSVIVLLGILGYLFNTILLAVERRVLSWHRGARRA